MNSEKEKEQEKEKDKSSLLSNNIYSNLSTSEEINISFEKSKNEICQSLSRDIFRCHLCKELLTTKIKIENEESFNIDYRCPNNHFGYLEIGLFLSKISKFSFIYAKCAKCGEKQNNSTEIFYFCKDCEEIYCPKDIKECKQSKENIVSLEDLDYLCIIHKKDYVSYCEVCKKNLCEICAQSEEHQNHNKYIFKEKIIDKVESFDEYIQKGGNRKNKFEKEIENNISLAMKDKFEEIANDRNIIIENINVYGHLIFYAYCIKKAYDFSVNCNRFNHQIISNLYELINNQLIIIDNKMNSINILFNKLYQKIPLYSSLKKECLTAIANKNGIKIKDLIINNSNNNININPEQMANNNFESKKIVIKKYIFEDGEYAGEIKEGLPHGLGTFKYKNGDEYTGEFKNGLFDGNGEHISKKSGEKYSGEFKKGKRDGNGICTFSNKESYCGYWKDNKRDGKGKYSFSNGDYYQGEFKEDMFNGKGILIYSNGNKTIGTWKNNYRNGIEYLFNKKGEIFYHFYENNTLIQEKKLDVNYLKDCKNATEEEIIEYMKIFYQKQLKKK